MEWNAVEWNGMDWNGACSFLPSFLSSLPPFIPSFPNGMEWDGLGWNGMERNGTERNNIKHGCVRGTYVLKQHKALFFMRNMFPLTKRITHDLCEVNTSSTKYKA